MDTSTEAKSIYLMALRVCENRKVECAWDVVFGVFGRRSYVNDHRVSAYMCAPLPIARLHGHVTLAGAGGYVLLADAVFPIAIRMPTHVPERHVMNRRIAVAAPQGKARGVGVSGTMWIRTQAKLASRSAALGDGVADKHRAAGRMRRDQNAETEHDAHQ